MIDLKNVPIKEDDCYILNDEGGYDWTIEYTFYLRWALGYREYHIYWNTKTDEFSGDVIESSGWRDLEDDELEEIVEALKPVYSWRYELKFEEGEDE